MNDAEVSKLSTALQRSGEAIELALNAKASLFYVGLRTGAQTGSEKYRYVNVAAGAWDASSRQFSGPLRAARDLLASRGLGNFLDIVPGPLFRATHGKRLSHMPLTTRSSYTHLMGALRGAWDISSSMEEPDEELDLDGLESPKWGHQTFRRTADKIARASTSETGASKTDIDDMFGWKQAERAKDMQMHYSGYGDRVHRAKITMLV